MTTSGASAWSRNSLIPVGASGTLVKGVAFRTNVACFELMCPGKLDAVLEACSVELREGIQYRKLIATGWYPVEWYRELLAAMVDKSGRNADEFTRELGRRAAMQDINGVYKALLKLVKPATLLSLYSRLFSNYYSKGKLLVEADSRNYARIMLRDCEGFDHNMYVEILGSAEQYLELTGAMRVLVQLVSGGRDGMSHATYEGRWG